MGKKKHKKKRKDKKQRPDEPVAISLSGMSYPVYSWGLSNFLSPRDTPFLSYLQRAIAPPPKTDPLTDQDVEVAALAADQIVRKHKKE